MPRQHFSLRFPHYTQFINTLKSANEQPECWTEHEVWILIILNMHFPCKNTHFLNTYHCQSSEHHYHTLPWYEAHVLQFQSAKENWYRLSLSQHNKENAMRQLKSFLEQSSVVFFPDAFEDFSPCNKLSSFSKKRICMFDIHVSFILTINAWCFLDKFWAPVKSRPKKCENKKTKNKTKH